MYPFRWQVRGEEKEKLWEGPFLNSQCAHSGSEKFISINVIASASIKMNDWST